MRRIQTYEFKLSVFLLIVVTFIVPANIRQNGTLIVYNFGFPCNYWSIYQGSEGSYILFDNLFNGNRGMDINILSLFFNIVIIYALVILLKKIYIKFISN
ncbi:MULTISPECIES: hypothetical protein [Clostridium]|uniref:Uncharacterized protein n=1 Tax=Clostridium neonatale TaxID=137838 RepID=A0A650M973_9CLOT|nr:MULTISPECIES: hypothetical protein [Clostridium]MDU4846433.1 hypothetical protein [Clostridium sp.]CAG9709396.1 Conserved hypothetical protein [Clostridium neonatale]CAI3209376.1 Conserved hypothetical protein [Clostridium neonatale]CAI3215259.1 Conserved hypothetical protein [Clostridium neonatale]CAI3540768.1 Conserved hypothetical protein [Clostridium neonatale]